MLSLTLNRLESSQFIGNPVRTGYTEVHKELEVSGHRKF
jgi:hypothetical protein